MKVIITMLLAVTLHTALLSQTVNYTIESDDPEFSNLLVAIEPWYIDASKLNFPMGFGAAVLYTGKPIIVSAIYNRAYFDFNKFSLNATPDLKPHSSLEIGVGMPFIRKNIKKDLRVTLSSSSSGGYTTSTYLTIPGTVKRTVALRGGIWRYRNSYDNEDIGDVVLDSVTLVARTLDYNPGVNQPGNFISNLTVNAMYAGISIVNVKKLTISSEDFSGFRSNTSTDHVYFDALLAPFVNAGTYTHTGNPTDVNNLLAPGVYDLNDGYKAYKSRLGFRMGWQFNQGFRSSKRSLTGWYARMEAGSRPGLKKAGWYMMLAFGFGINGKV